MTLPNKLLLAVVAAVGLGWLVADRAEWPRVAADPQDPFLDSDGDLLPDRLEWVLMTHPGRTDSDRDGVDDFLEAVQHIPPTNSTTRRPLDHEMRAVVHTIRDPAQREFAVLDMLFRFATGGPEHVTNLEPFLTVQDVPVPLTGIVGRGMTHLVVRHVPQEGTYLLTSAILGTADQVRTLLPCTVGLRGSIGQKHVASGTHLVDVNGEICAIMPVSDTAYTLQSMSDDQGRKFWRGNHMCKLELLAMGTGWRSFVVEVTSAECTGTPVLTCPPDCTNQLGRIIVLPFGLGFLRGG